MKNRKGEPEKTHFRSERFFVVDDKHYFSTREGTEIGPFGSRVDAELGLERYIRCISDEKGCEKTARDAALQGDWATTHYR